MLDWTFVVSRGHGFFLPFVPFFLCRARGERGAGGVDGVFPRWCFAIGSSSPSRPEGAFTVVSSPTKPASSGLVGLVPDGGCLTVFEIGSSLLWFGLETDDGCLIVLLVFWLSCLYFG